MAATCAVGPCQEARVEGDLYCVQHGPRRGRTAATRTGPGDTALVCPHCGVKGHVRSEQVKVKQGISGGKATGAVLTAGFSLFATGLSRKHKVTRRTCSECGTVWDVA